MLRMADRRRLALGWAQGWPPLRRNSGPPVDQPRPGGRGQWATRSGRSVWLHPAGGEIQASGAQAEFGFVCGEASRTCDQAQRILPPRASRRRCDSGMEFVGLRRELPLALTELAGTERDTRPEPKVGCSVSFPAVAIPLCMVPFHLVFPLS